MTHSRLCLLAVLLGLTGCSQIEKPDLMLTGGTSDVVQRSSLAPLASTEQAPTEQAEAAPIFFAGTGSIVEYDADVGALPEARGPGAGVPVKTEVLKPHTATFAMPEATSSLMDITNMANWSGYKTKRFLPPSLTLTIISIDEIRMALMAETSRY